MGQITKACQLDRSLNLYYSICTCCWQVFQSFALSISAIGYFSPTAWLRQDRMRVGSHMKNLASVAFQSILVHIQSSLPPHSLRLLSGERRTDSKKKKKKNSLVLEWSLSVEVRSFPLGSEGVIQKPYHCGTACCPVG